MCIRVKVYVYVTQPLLPHPLKYNVVCVLMYARDAVKMYRSAQHCVCVCVCAMCCTCVSVYALCNSAI